MNHFEFPQRFRALYDQAVRLQAAGATDPNALFNENERAWLAANGISPQHLYDYAEDHNKYGGEPGFEHALAIESVRRDYFLNVQHGRASTTTVDAAALPQKTDTARGIAWLPRLLPKAKAKLRGELPASLMFCCSGDRRFFKEHNIYPAEFLAMIARHESDEAAVVDWVVRRSGKA